MNFVVYYYTKLNTNNPKFMQISYKNASVDFMLNEFVHDKVDILYSLSEIKLIDNIMCPAPLYIDLQNNVDKNTLLTLFDSADAVKEFNLQQITELLYYTRDLN